MELMFSSGEGPLWAISTYSGPKSFGPNTRDLRVSDISDSISHQRNVAFAHFHRPLSVKTISHILFSFPPTLFGLGNHVILIAFDKPYRSLSYSFIQACASFDFRCFHLGLWNESLVYHSCSPSGLLACWPTNVSDILCFQSSLRKSSSVLTLNQTGWNFGFFLLSIMPTKDCQSPYSHSHRQAARKICGWCRWWQGHEVCDSIQHAFEHSDMER